MYSRPVFGRRDSTCPAGRYLAVYMHSICLEWGLGLEDQGVDGGSGS
jgi:hypothetical protein